MPLKINYLPMLTKIVILPHKVLHEFKSSALQLVKLYKKNPSLTGIYLPKKTAVSGVLVEDEVTLLPRDHYL